jgi:uncharacterized membrane protein YccC
LTFCIYIVAVALTSSVLFASKSLQTDTCGITVVMLLQSAVHNVYSFVYLSDAYIAAVVANS